MMVMMIIPEWNQNLRSWLFIMQTTGKKLINCKRKTPYGRKKKQTKKEQIKGKQYRIPPLRFVFSINGVLIEHDWSEESFEEFFFKDERRELYNFLFFFFLLRRNSIRFKNQWRWKVCRWCISVNDPELQVFVDESCRRLRRGSCWRIKRTRWTTRNGGIIFHSS